MIAYKGFSKELSSVMGNGQKETCQFVPGETKKVEESKTARSGFHCCENPFECLGYYPLDYENRYFQVEAAGSIDEDAGEKIACTELTLIRELTIKEFVGYGMAYMLQHPMRNGWEQNRLHLQVKKDAPVANEEGDIAIARGTKPIVRAEKEGNILGLIVEKSQGWIDSAKLFVVGKEQIGKWYTLKDGILQEVDYEKEGNRSVATKETTEKR